MALIPLLVEAGVQWDTGLKDSSGFKGINRCWRYRNARILYSAKMYTNILNQIFCERWSESQFLVFVGQFQASMLKGYYILNVY